MFNTLDLVTPQQLIFPQSWSKSARAMAKARGMSQAEVDAVEADLQTFRAKSAVHADERKSDERMFEGRWQSTYRGYAWGGDCNAEAIAKFRAMAVWVVKKWR